MLRPLSLAAEVGSANNDVVDAGPGEVGQDDMLVVLADAVVVQAPGDGPLWGRAR